MAGACVSIHIASTHTPRHNDESTGRMVCVCIGCVNFRLRTRRMLFRFAALQRIYSVFIVFFCEKTFFSLQKWERFTFLDFTMNFFGNNFRLERKTDLACVFHKKIAFLKRTLHFGGNSNLNYSH